MVTTPTTALAQAIREYMVSDHAHENGYDEMLDRRAKYLDMYASAGIEVDPDEELDAIDNADTEFWEYHLNVCQRHENAVAALLALIGGDKDNLRRLYSSRYGSLRDTVHVDWDRYATEGLYDPMWFSTVQE